jgi:TolB-like protein
MPPTQLGRGKWLRPVTLAAFLGVAAVGLAIWWPPATPSTASPSLTSLTQAVAVLPIKNLGGNPLDDLLTIAIADAVITRLSEIPSLTVVDRSTVREHRSASDDPMKAARDMGAGFVVTGGVQRVADKVAVSVRLVRSDSSIAWAQQYEVDPGELFALQKQIAQGLSTALKLRLTASERERVERAPTSNTEAYTDYLQGRAFLERPDVAGNVDRAIEIFQRATKREPSFGLAHAGLGEAYWEKYLATKQPEWTSKASASILEAVRLDPEQAQVRISLATVYQGTGRTDFAIEELRRALALQPRNDNAHRQLGEALGAKGSRIKRSPSCRRRFESAPTTGAITTRCRRSSRVKVATLRPLRSRAG